MAPQSDGRCAWETVADRLIKLECRIEEVTMQIGITSWSFEDAPPEEVFAWCSKHGLTGIYGTAEVRAGYAEQLRRDIEAAAQLGVGVVTIFAGRDPWKTVQENVSLFKDTFTPLVQLAEDRGVHLAMENCPQPNVWPAGGNMANTVENWRLLFEAVPSPRLGLTFDPSHFVWLGMDYIKAVHEFGSRIFSVHAKDTEILDGILADTGILGKGWWRYRLPGWGAVDWPAFFTALREVGYQGPVCIEHEDALWNDSLDEHKQGILMAARFLGQFDL
jgi:sugar phosphate isomerase/epimerase